MNRRAQVCTHLLIIALVLGLSGTARATTLTTSLVIANGGQAWDCVVTNVGTKPVMVTATVVDNLGAVVTPVTDSCNGKTLPPNLTCQVKIATDTDAFCKVSGRGTLRANVTIVEGTTPFATQVVVPATAR